MEWNVIDNELTHRTTNSCSLYQKINNFTVWNSYSVIYFKFIVALIKVPQPVTRTRSLNVTCHTAQSTLWPCHTASVGIFTAYAYSYKRIYIINPNFFIYIYIYIYPVFYSLNRKMYKNTTHTEIKVFIIIIKRFFSRRNIKISIEGTEGFRFWSAYLFSMIQFSDNLYNCCSCRPAFGHLEWYCELFSFFNFEDFWFKKYIYVSVFQKKNQLEQILSQKFQIKLIWKLFRTRIDYRRPIFCFWFFGRLSPVLW